MRLILCTCLSGGKLVKAVDEKRSQSTISISSGRKLECESFSQLYFLVVIECWFKFPKCLVLLLACSKGSRKRLRAGLLSLPAVASSLACYSLAYFSRYPQNGELARRLTLRRGTSLVTRRKDNNKSV